MHMKTLKLGVTALHLCISQSPLISILCSNFFSRKVNFHLPTRRHVVLARSSTVLGIRVNPRCPPPSCRYPPSYGRDTPTVCSSAPHSHLALLVIPHFFFLATVLKTPILKRFHLVYSFLDTSISRVIPTSHISTNRGNGWMLFAINFAAWFSTSESLVSQLLTH